MPLSQQAQTVMADSPYPEMKKTHTMARQGRPWTDFKPPPSAPVWNVLCGLASYSVLLAARELDVFEELQRSGSCGSGELAERLQVSPKHLGILLDSLVVLGLLDQCRDVYDLNDTARRYLLSDSPASMLDLLPVAAGPAENWNTLAETIRDGEPNSPIDDDPVGFYVPLVEGTFATQLRVAQRADLFVGYSRLDSPRVLEIGAGGAPWSVAVLQTCGRATAVVNDLEGVIDVAKLKATEFGVANRCEFRPGNYHDVTLEQEHFDIVVLGHICRAEGSGGTASLLARAYEALRVGGQVFVTDYFCDPTRKHNPHGVLMGATMMANTRKGATFTPEEFQGLLRDAGFGQSRLVEPIGFQYLVVATKSVRARNHPTLMP